MRYVPVACPRCEATHEYLLSREDHRHLRQCPDCAGWFVRDETADTVESLGEPPTCPVESCEETLQSDRLPIHVIDEHDGSLVAE